MNFALSDAEENIKSRQTSFWEIRHFLFISIMEYFPILYLPKISGTDWCNAHLQPPQYSGVWHYTTTNAFSENILGEWERVGRQIKFLKVSFIFDLHKILTAISKKCVSSILFVKISIKLNTKTKGKKTLT